jgi:hypothetical protein
MTVAYRLELGMLPAMIPEEYHADLDTYVAAIEAVRAGDEDALIAWPGENEPFARAYQVVAIFDLTAFTIPRDEPMENE